MNNSGGSVTSELLGWRDWALETANDVDPVARRRQSTPIGYAEKDDAMPPKSYMPNQSPTHLKSGPDYWLKQAIFKRR